MTPVRACTLTGARLPSFFLIRFELLAHPETSVPWLIPTGLESPVELSRLQSNPKLAGDSVKSGTRRNDKQSILESVPFPSSPGAYGLARHSIFEKMTPRVLGKRNKNKSNWGRLLSLRMRGRYSLEQEDVHWRGDMGNFILRLLRLRVVSELVYLAKRTDKGYIKYCSQGLAASILTEHVGSVLWLNPSKSRSDYAPVTDNLDHSLDHNLEPYWDYMCEPSAYARVFTEGSPARTVVVYNLPNLLGADHLGKLQEQLEQHQAAEILLLKYCTATVRVQKWLWNLQGHLATSADLAQGREDW